VSHQRSDQTLRTQHYRDLRLVFKDHSRVFLKRFGVSETDGHQEKTNKGLDGGNSKSDEPPQGRNAEVGKASDESL
jgi:hypothetical protein